MSYRDFVVVRSPGQSAWRTVMADVEDSVGRVRLSVAPGETEIHWHPPYTYTQGEQFVDSLRHHPLVKVEKLGETDEGRNLWLLRITDDSPRAKKPALIYARCHAYESAGSYTMEGMVRWLISGEPYAARAVREYAFHVIPMMNPDGVFHGWAKLTAPHGVDPQFISPATSRVQQAVKRAMDRVRPVLFIDLHNWQNKHTDGVLFLEPAVLERFVRYMPDQLAFGKQWQFREPTPTPAKPPEKELGRMYLQRMYKPLAVTFEFPWFGRTPDDVRAAGRTALWALLRAVEDPKTLGQR
jgi:murein tripeptide amidase MpaA